MTMRALGFLLIGLGTGLVLAAVAIVAFAFSPHHMFIIGIAWRPGSLLLALPLVFIAIGVGLARRGAPRKRRTN